MDLILYTELRTLVDLDPCFHSSYGHEKACKYRHHFDQIFLLPLLYATVIAKDFFQLKYCPQLVQPDTHCHLSKTALANFLISV